MGYRSHVLILFKVNVQLSSRLASALIRLYKVSLTDAGQGSYLTYMWTQLYMFVYLICGKTDDTTE